MAWYRHSNNQYLPFLAAVKLYWLFSFSCWIKDFQAFYYHGCNCQGQCVSLIKTWSRTVSLLWWISFPFACSGPGIFYCVTFWIRLRSQRPLFVQFLLESLLLFCFPTAQGEVELLMAQLLALGVPYSSLTHLPGAWAEISPFSSLNKQPGKLVNIFMLLWAKSGASCDHLAWCAAIPLLFFNVQVHPVLIH